MLVTRWLSHDEQVLWRAWLTAITLVPERLSRELQDEFGINMSDYDILVRLSESDEHALRMSELANKTVADRRRRARVRRIDGERHRLRGCPTGEG